LKEGIMAAWQFSIVLIPQKWAIENKYDPSFMYDGGYDTEMAWKENQPAKDFVDILSQMLPPSKSWHDDLLCWGDEKGHDIQVWFENNVIDGIHIRLDLNRNLNSILARLVAIAQKLDCVLFYPELKTITEANEFELKNTLRMSNAARFVKNPTGSIKKY
jgi:hypothetical protein